MCFMPETDQLLIRMSIPVAMQGEKNYIKLGTRDSPKVSTLLQKSETNFATKSHKATHPRRRKFSKRSVITSQIPSRIDEEVAQRKHTAFQKQQLYHVKSSYAYVVIKKPDIETSDHNSLWVHLEYFAP